MVPLSNLGIFRSAVSSQVEAVTKTLLKFNFVHLFVKSSENDI